MPEKNVFVPTRQHVCLVCKRRKFDDSPTEQGFQQIRHQPCHPDHSPGTSTNVGPAPLPKVGHPALMDSTSGGQLKLGTLVKCLDSFDSDLPSRFSFSWPFLNLHIFPNLPRNAQTVVAGAPAPPNVTWRGVIKWMCLKKLQMAISMGEIVINGQTNPAVNLWTSGMTSLPSREAPDARSLD